MPRLSEYHAFGARVVTELLDDILKFKSGVVNSGNDGEDIEPVHCMRVGTRRLREALPLFRACFDSNEFEAISCDIKRVTRALGLARDLDVQIEAIDSAAKDNFGLSRLLLRRRQKRASLNTKLARVVSEFELASSVKDVNSRVRAILGGAYI